MQQLSLKHRLNNGDSVYGIFNSIPDPLMIEVIAASGYDFVVIDTEHVAINDETLADLIRAAEAAHIIPIVRVQVTSHVQHIFEVVNAHGKHFCALPREDEDIAKWQAQGVQTFILGDDRGKIYRHLSASLATSKQKGDEG
nr:aldolase/citrate lyase family protein [Staphylococcus aureus]